MSHKVNHQGDLGGECGGTYAKSATGLADGGDNLDSPGFLLSNDKDVLGWVCGVTQSLKWKVGDAPLFDRFSAYGRWDVDEVNLNTPRFEGISCKDVSPKDHRVPVRGVMF